MNKQISKSLICAASDLNSLREYGASQTWIRRRAPVPLVHTPIGCGATMARLMTGTRLRLK
jgi:hypothetical protein